MATERRDPFEVTLKPDQEKELAAMLAREIDDAILARDRIVGDDATIDAAYKKYEGGDKHLTKNTPWPNASNLGSPIVTEKVDALRARIVSTIYTDPIWTVEGYGTSAQKAPLVENYHQWKAEVAGLQKTLSRVIHVSLVEGTGVLETTDRVELRKGLRRMRVLLQRDPVTGAVMLGPDGAPIPVIKGDGKFQEASDGEPHVSVIASDVVRATAGPSYRVHSLKNFFIMPGHASEKADIWGYAKRFWRRRSVLMQLQEQGVYQNVDQLPDAGERLATPEELRMGQDIAHQSDGSVELEIWEINLLADLDGDGFDEWYVVTFHKERRVILRVQYLDYNTPHYTLFTPFPRPNSVYGYSYAEDKLGSLYDEHAALRNMFMDRSTLATSAPLKVLEGSPFDVNPKPWGPREKLRVRDMNDVMPLDVKDVPNSVMAAMTQCLQFAERISGQNDTSTGVLAQQDRTLGEVKITTEQSFVRIDEVVKNCQEAMEELFLINHAIYVNALEQGNGEELPDVITQSLAERGIEKFRVTAEDLFGTFRGKPKGSVEASDFSRMRADFAQLMTALTQMGQVAPALAMHINNPNFLRSFLSQMARVYRWPDRQNLVAGFTGQPPMPAPGMMPPGMVPPGSPAPQMNGGPSAPVTGPAPNQQ